MRVLQLIDSLRTGGAERMAVTYANALTKRIDGSFLCCTRIEGVQREQLFPEVGYLFLKKKNTLDLKAFLRLRSFIKKNRIDLIQAHSTSFFLAVLVKMSLPGLKMVWHDHYGKALDNRNPGTLKIASLYFDGIISVNLKLKEWVLQNLHPRKVIYIRNFLPDVEISPSREGNLKVSDGPSIICVANLRPQKDHLTLLKAFGLLLEKEPGLSLHLVGKDNGDSYSQQIKSYIRDNDMEDKVFLYGERQEISGMLQQASLGVLSSASEGLPVALLEYGRAGLPVVCTQVGECEEVIGEAGKLVPPGKVVFLAKAISSYLEDEEQRKTAAAAFQQKIKKEFLEEAIMPEVLDFFESLYAAAPNQQLQAHRTADNRSSYAKALADRKPKTDPPSPPQSSGGQQTENR